MADRKWSSYGSDGEPADDFVDEEGGGVVADDVAAANEASTDNFEDNGGRITEATSSASFMTSFVTSDGDLRRPRTTADGCEDEAGAGALDLIRHALLPSAGSRDSLHHSTSWKALDDAAGSGEELDSYVNPRRLSVGGKLLQTTGPQSENAPPW